MQPGQSTAMRSAARCRRTQAHLVASSPGCAPARWAAGRLAADATVTLALVIAHGAILLGQVRRAAAQGGRPGPPPCGDLRAGTQPACLARNRSGQGQGHPARGGARGRRGARCGAGDDIQRGDEQRARARAGRAADRQQLCGDQGCARGPRGAPAPARRRAAALPATAPARARRRAGWQRAARPRAGTIFKRFDAGKLFTLTCQDVAERFHLALSLLFVVVEEMDNAGSRAPNRALLQRCGAIFAAEVAIDVTKHAVVTKFSDVRPGVYRQFLHVRARRAPRRVPGPPQQTNGAAARPSPLVGASPGLRPVLPVLPASHVMGRGRARAAMRCRALLRATGATATSGRVQALHACAQQPAKPARHQRRPGRRRGRRARRAPQDVCEKTRGSQSHTAHRVVAFEPYAPAALFLRIAATYLGAHRAAAGAAAPRALAGRAGWLGAAALAWAALFAAKAALGFWLRAAAVHHLRRAARRAR